MKLSSIYSLALAAGAVGFVIPDQEVLAQVPNAEPADLREDVQRLWNHASHDAKAAYHELSEEIQDAAHGVAAAFDDAVNDGREAWESFEADALAAAEESMPHCDFSIFDDDDDNDDLSKYTVYELIHKSQQTTLFAKLVDEFDDVKELLSDPDGDFTVFVPTDKVLEKLPKLGDKVSKEFHKAVLQYHIVPKSHTARQFIGVSTVPTLLSGDQLSVNGTETPHRLSIGVGLRGITVNRLAHIYRGNFVGANGVIHALTIPLFPPARLGAVIPFVPTVFSTLELAFRKTRFGFEIVNQTHYGATIFAPANDAWKKLGFGATGFLFSQAGRRYLRALLKYHIVPSRTLYSDHYYPSGDEDSASIPRSRKHFDLPTMLGDTRVAVDIGKIGPLTRMHVNHYSRVGIPDIMARDGVIQAINSVLIPSRPKQEAYDGQSEMSVDELKDRLEPFLEPEGDAADASYDEFAWDFLEL